MPNHYLSVLYKHIIQVENENVVLKVCVCVCVGGGGGGAHAPLAPSPHPPLPTPVCWNFYLFALKIYTCLFKPKIYLKLNFIPCILIWT